MVSRVSAIPSVCLVATGLVVCQVSGSFWLDQTWLDARELVQQRPLHGHLRGWEHLHASHTGDSIHRKLAEHASDGNSTDGGATEADSTDAADTDTSTGNGTSTGEGDPAPNPSPDPAPSDPAPSPTPAATTDACGGSWSAWSACEPPQSSKPWSGALNCVLERTYTAPDGASCTTGNGAKEVKECTTSSGMCAPAASPAPAPASGNGTTDSGSSGSGSSEGGDGEVVSVSSKVGEMAREVAPTCKIAAAPKPDMKGFTDVKGFITAPKVGDEILKAQGGDPGFMVFGLSTFAMAPPFLAPVIGLVLAFFCTSCGVCRVCFRKCRRCCGTRRLCRCCCGERKERGPFSRKKKILIIIFTVVGVAGMAAVWQVGTLPPKGADASLLDGFDSGKNADCAANLFVDYMVNGYFKETEMKATDTETSERRLSNHSSDDSTDDSGDNGTSAPSSDGAPSPDDNPADSTDASPAPAADPSPSPAPVPGTRDTSPLPPTGEFLGLERAAQTLGFMKSELASASQLAKQAVDVSAAVEEAMIRLGHMRSTLGSQVTKDGHQCEFCNWCCGSDSAFAPTLRSELASSDVKAVGDGVEPGSSLETSTKALQSANSTISELRVAIDIGPAAAVMNSKDFFNDASILPNLGFGFLAGLGLAGIGLLGLFYAFKCCQRCRCARKEYPAPQFAAYGWCGGCLAAIIACAIGFFAFFTAAVSAEVCMFMDEIVTPAGLETYGNPLGLGSARSQTSYIKCLSPATEGSRDLYVDLDLDTNFQALTTLDTSVRSVRGGTDSVVAKFDKLVSEADAKASQFAPAWTSSAKVYTCETLTFTAGSNDDSKVQISPQPCNPTEFADHQKQLANQAKSALKAAVDAITGGSQWTKISSSLQTVVSDSARIRNHLNCDPVFKRYKQLHSQVCGGLTTAYWNAGQGWCLVALCGLIAGTAQYKLWKHLRDNRSLYFDEHEDEKPKGCCRRIMACFCGCAVGEPGEAGEDTPLAGGGEADEGDGEGKKRCCFCCRRRSKGDAEAKPAKEPKKKKGKVDPAAEKITAKFNGAFDISVEEAIKEFLTQDLYADYDPAFIKLAVEERKSSLKADPKDKKGKKDKKGPPKDPVMPEEPAGGDPKEMFKDEYTDFDKDGMPKADADGKPLDKKTLAKVKKQFDPAKKAWDTYLADKKAYEAFALGKARREDLSEGAEVIYPDDIQYLRIISTKTNKPLKVILKDIPEDTSKAIFSDELKQVVGLPIDAQIRKQKPMIPKFKGLSDRCYESTKADLISKLMNLCKSDAAIWEGCVAAPAKKGAKKGGKEPQPPKEPKGMVNPAEMFQTGKNSDKYEDFDDDGVPKAKSGGTELKEKEIKALRKQWEKTKAVWDKHQAAVAKYETDLAAFKAASGEGEEKPAEEDTSGIPDAQKEESCAAAGKILVNQLVDKMLAEHVDELAARVNRGEDDPDDLKAILVTEVLEEEEIITDPVLKAFRRFDEERTNACSTDQLKGIFEALGEDELEVGTHKFYSEVTEGELTYVQPKMQQTSAVSDGMLQYEGLKTFVEDKDVAVLAGKEPTNLVSCLMAMRMDTWFSGGEMENVWSPRTWRAKLGEEFGESSKKETPKGGKARKSTQGAEAVKAAGKKKTAKEEETNEVEEAAGSARNEEEEAEDNEKPAGGKKKRNSVGGSKDKKKKDEGEEVAPRKSESGKKEKKAKKDEEEEEAEPKKEKKEKKEKKSKK